MKKYLYLIKKAKIKSWLKFWLLTKDQVKYILSEILEGFSFNLQNTVKRYFKIFNIFGNSVQDGIPTPTNPVTIESVADDGTVTIKLIGKNEFTISNFQKRGWDIAIDNPLKGFNSGQYTISCVNAYKENKGIAIVFSNQPFDGIIGNYFTGYNFGNGIKYNNTQTITQEQINAEYMRLMSTDNGVTQEVLENMQIQIEEGSTPTSYEPYQANDFTFQTEPLRSLPNGVRDSLEADGIHRKIVIQTGTLSQTTTITLSDAKQNGAYMCNIKSAGTLTGKTIELEAGDYEIIYELAEVVIEPYTEEQQEQYNKIKELYTFDGTTNISSDVVPPYLQIQYYMKGE